MSSTYAELEEFMSDIISTWVEKLEKNNEGAKFDALWQEKGVNQVQSEPFKEYKDRLLDRNRSDRMDEKDGYYK